MAGSASPIMRGHTGVAAGSQSPGGQSSVLRAGLLASSALITTVLWPGAPALAQQCQPTGTNQTCTNSIFLTGGDIGLFDNGTAPGLTVTNTNTGTISGSNPAQQAAGIQ